MCLFQNLYYQQSILYTKIIVRSYNQTQITVTAKVTKKVNFAMNLNFKPHCKNF